MVLALESLPVNFLSSESLVDSMLIPIHVRKLDVADISTDARRTAIYPRNDRDNEFHQSRVG